MIVNPTKWSYIKTLKLAYEKFHTPGSIDILIGAGSAIQDCSFSGRIVGLPGQPPPSKPSLDGYYWEIQGSLFAKLIFFQSDESLDSSLKKFWELETIKPKVFLCLNEKK